MIEWKDRTSYSRDDKVREPRTWVWDTGQNVHVTVTRHIDYPGRWVVMAQWQFREVVWQLLNSELLEDAKVEAVEVVRSEFLAAAEAVSVKG